MSQTNKTYALLPDIWAYPPRLLPQPKIRRPLARWQLRCLYAATILCLSLGLSIGSRTSHEPISRQIGSLPVLSASSIKLVPAKTTVISTASAITATAATGRLPSDTSNPAGSLASIGSGSYSFGQCTYYVATRRYVPKGWGNASEWLGHAKAAGFHTDNIPVNGAIAWSSVGWVGHVAYVEQVAGGKVLITEMNNWGASGGGWNRVDKRWAAVSDFKYIY